MATAPFQDNPEAAADVVAAFDSVEQALPADDDIFGDLAAMDDLSMSTASGGASTAFDIGHVGVAIGENDASVNNIEANYSENGDIMNNNVADNRGITTVFYNTGNGVVFQSNVNVNVFLGSKSVTGQ